MSPFREIAVQPLYCPSNARLPFIYAVTGCQFDAGQVMLVKHDDGLIALRVRFERGGGDYMYCTSSIFVVVRHCTYFILITNKKAAGQLSLQPLGLHMPE